MSKLAVSELLHSDARLLAASAKKQGVNTTLQLAPGLWHDWQLFAGQMPEADASLKLIAQFAVECLSLPR